VELTPAAVDAPVELALFEMVGGCYYDPLAFVVACFPWGMPGTPLEHFAGPDQWQRQELKEIGRQVRLRAFNGRDPVSPIRRAISSGHGIGKSALTAFIGALADVDAPRCPRHGYRQHPHAAGNQDVGGHSEMAQAVPDGVVVHLHDRAPLSPEQQGNLVLHAADVQGRELGSLRRAACRDLDLLLHL
jgi:hypothetical protein